MRGAKCGSRWKRQSHTLVVRLFPFFTRGDGSLELALTQDVRTLGPRQGDSLEPTVQSPDVVGFPRSAVGFARHVRSSLLATLRRKRHRNPIFDESVGVAFHRVLTVDTLHALYLGVMLACCRHCVWVLLSSDIWSGGARTAEERVALGVRRLRWKLSKWYKARGNATGSSVLQPLRLRRRFVLHRFGHWLWRVLEMTCRCVPELAQPRSVWRTDHRFVELLGECF